MIVQIYTAQTAEEAIAMAELGVDHIGITPSQLGLPGEVGLEQAAEIFAAVGDRATRVALSVDPDPEEILRMVEIVRPDVLHLCGDIDVVTADVVRSLRPRLAGVRIMQAIPMTGPQALAQAREFAPVCDMLILDSDSAEIGGIGATGFTHDWSLSRQIVESVQVPVILAGGLPPDNVADAISAVGPWGVDSLTHTNLALPSGGFRKDLDKVREFISASRQSAADPAVAR